MSLNGTEFKELLKQKGFKLTTQRRAVLEIMQDRKGEHLTTEEIYELVRDKCPEIGLATVYRTVQLLDNLKLIRKLNLDDGCCRYELGLEDEDHHHHHLICEECGKVIEVAEDLLDPLETKIEDLFNFKITDHKLKFYGVCEECHGKNE